MVQTVTWLSGLLSCRKSLRSDLSVRVSMSNEVSVSPRRMAFLVADTGVALYGRPPPSRARGRSGGRHCTAGQYVTSR